MKNLLMFLVFSLITVVFLGSFTVNTGETAIVVSKTHHNTYYNKPGLYFALPFFNTVNLIYMNNREAIVSLGLNSESGNNYVKQNIESGNKQIVIDLLVNWHVNSATDYFSVLQKNGQVDFNKNLVDNISNSLLRKIHGQNISSLNQLNSILNDAQIIKNLGVSLDSVNIVSVDFIDNASAAKAIVVDSDASNSTSHSILDMQNKMIESAYYQAQMIKTDTEINQAMKYHQIETENPKFYNYFRLIDVYKTSSKDKLDVPAFNKLYH